MNDRTANLRQRLSWSEKGQDLSEYGLLVGFIAMILVIAVTVFGENLLAFFSRLAAEIAAVL